MNNKKSSYEHECTLHLSFQSQFGDNDVDKDLENDDNLENDNDLKNERMMMILRIMMIMMVKNKQIYKQINAKIDK